MAFLAWIGLGADGLSSSAYGPDQAFKALEFSSHGDHRELAIFLALATALTVIIISLSYSHIIEHFPTGGGGYVVASKLLGPMAGLVSGCALLIDYILTITVSIASGAEAVFAFLPHEYLFLKLPFECLTLAGLIVLNLRGLKESIIFLLPIFILFLATHAVLLVAVLADFHVRIPVVAEEVKNHLHQSFRTLGLWTMFLIFARAYSQGAGTFTGIEAVSNGLTIMREPRVETGKKTMMYMAISLAITAGGLLLSYQLAGLRASTVDRDLPMNAILLEKLSGVSTSLGPWFSVLTLVSEALLLVIAAQTGFIDGPRVMSNMAIDSWVPHMFTSLSHRLTIHYGVVLMGLASFAALIYTSGHVSTLVIMYSINVFITFSLSQLGMCRFYITHWKTNPQAQHALPIQALGLVLCVSILVLVITEKFLQGAWLTLVATSALIGLCLVIRRHYDKVEERISRVTVELPEHPEPSPPLSSLDIQKPTAVLLVRGFDNLTVASFKMLRNLFGTFFTQVIFVSISVIDTGTFKGREEIQQQKQHTQLNLDKCVAMAKKHGVAATSLTMVANEPVLGAAELCVEVALRFQHAIFFGGKLVFEKETWYSRLLHNETAIAIQNRLQYLGYPMLILPIKIW